MRLRLSGAEKKQLAKQYTENSDAYQSYIWARYFYNKNTKEGYEKSIEYYKQAIEKDRDNAPERWDRRPLLAYAYAVTGRRAEALKILDEQNTLAKQRYISPFNFAIIYTGLGDRDRAFEELGKCYEQRTQILHRIKSLPMFDSLRSDPRYAELLRKMNLAP